MVHEPWIIAMGMATIMDFLMEKLFAGVTATKQQKINQTFIWNKNASLFLEGLHVFFKNQ